MEANGKNTAIISNKSKISIFDFSDYKGYLNAVLFPEGNYNHQSNTLSKWAKKLGYKSPSTLTMILKGQRVPSMELVRSISEVLKLKAREKEYFELLVEHERQKRKNKDTGATLNKLNKLGKKTSYFQVGLNKFNSFSRWYYLVIKQLVGAPEFIEDIDWIHRKLKRKATPLQIKNAIKDMLEIGILERKNGELTVSNDPTITLTDVPSSAIKEHHTGMMKRGLEALYEVPMEQRQISSLSMKMDASRLTEAKNELMDFLKDFNEKYSDTSANEVFQLNLQLFPHTRETNQ